MKKSYFSSRDTRYAQEEGSVTRYSYGRATPKSGTMGACLCPDPNNITYSRKCCKGYLFNQGIGGTQAPYPTGSR